MRNKAWMVGIVAIFAFVGVLASYTADASMVRASGTWFFGPRAVWTDGTSNPMFHPLSDPIVSAGLTKVRTSIEMDQDSGNCKIRTALRYSGDSVIWNTAQEYPDDVAYLDAPGVTYGSSYVDITSITGATPGTWVQFGVQVANQTGADIQLCNAALRVEPEQRR